MKKTICNLFLLTVLLIISSASQAKKTNGAPPRSFYAIRVYHATTAAQESSIETYLQNALVPALHSKGFKAVGVFKAIGNDTAADKKIYVFLPLKSLDQLVDMDKGLLNNKTVTDKGQDYVNAVYNTPPYSRFETIVLHAFEGMPGYEIPKLTSAKKDRVYELRSYEGPTEKLYLNKVDMFNKGDEVGLFKRLGFNAVFYAEVVSGAHMPNLMYMTTFENKQAREEHWKTFGDDPYWKQLSAKPEYQHNVSKADIFFLTPTDYSDF